MKYIVAVSGGVDSVVLLDILSRGDDKLIVAHVDHGIREDSAADARFVSATSKLYGIPCEQIALRLGSTASEEQAREARYEYLYSLATKHSATIVTAHHQDDLIGSITVNLTRGTGWRGLAVMNREGIRRPLLGWTKRKIYDYALTHRLEWVEDYTNSDKKYLRNRLRAGVISLDGEKARQVVELRQRQIQLAHDIDRESARLVEHFGTSRHAYTQVDHATAIEMLRCLVEKRVGYRPQIDQAERLLIAIKTSKPNTSIDVVRGIYVQFGRTDFVVDTSR